jgi:hypothetical protein
MSLFDFWLTINCTYVTKVVLDYKFYIYIYICKGHPIIGHEDPEGEQMYCSTLPSTSALDGGVGGQHHAPAALPPLETRYALYRRLGGRRGRSGRVRKISPTPGFDLRKEHPVASRYTDWAVAATRKLYVFYYYWKTQRVVPHLQIRSFVDNIHPPKVEKERKET